MATSLSQTVLYPALTPVRVSSTANVAGTYQNGPTNSGVGATLTIAASSLTVDSVLTVAGDRVILTGQTNTNENGIYIVKTIGSTVVLERSGDLQCGEHARPGLYCSVMAGTARAGSKYTIIEPSPAVFGVNALAFA